MRILFAITGLCFLVLIWAMFAIRRHVLAAAQMREEQQNQRDNPQQKLRTMAAELQQYLRAKHSAAGFFRGAPPQRAPITESPQPIVSPPAPPTRKSAISVSGAKMERLDWAHFNQDLGDLSDPYQPPRTLSRPPAARASAIHRRQH